MRRALAARRNLAFVSKLNPTGSSLVYSTYLGSPQGTVTPTVATTIAVDAAGNAYVAGMTLSSTFPTVDPIQLNPIQVSGQSACLCEHVEQHRLRIALLNLPGRK